MTGWNSAKQVARKRKALLKRDGNLCCWCKKPMDLTTARPFQIPSPYSVTIEHIVPRAEGGSNALGNLALAHRRCNMERAFVAQRQARRASGAR